MTYVFKPQDLQIFGLTLKLNKYELFFTVGGGSEKQFGEHLSKITWWVI